MDSNIAAALIGALLGFGSSAVFTVWRDTRRDLREKRRVATALLCEVLILSDFLVVIDDAFAGSLSSKEPPKIADQLHALLPPSPTVYPALADRLPTLDTTTATRVVEFYGAMSWVEMQIRSPLGERLLSRVWRANSYTLAGAAAAIEALRAVADIGVSGAYGSSVRERLMRLGQPVRTPAWVSAKGVITPDNS